MSRVKCHMSHIFGLFSTGLPRQFFQQTSINIHKMALASARLEPITCFIVCPTLTNINLTICLQHKVTRWAAELIHLLNILGRDLLPATKNMAMPYCPARPSPLLKFVQTDFYKIVWFQNRQQNQTASLATLLFYPTPRTLPPLAWNKSLVYIWGCCAPPLFWQVSSP